MEYSRAKALAESYFEQRRKIRLSLIRRARENCDRHQELFSNEEKRRLFAYPSDFVETKLIEMAERSRGAEVDYELI